MSGGPAAGLRTLAGLGVSAVFLWLAARSVDLAAFGAALEALQPWALAGAVLIAVAEVSVRGWRWRRLLAPLADVSTPMTTAYLCIGHLANAILPARLGDLVRTHLAARRFGLARLPVLGTLVIERVSDAAFLAGVVGLSVLLGYSALIPLVVQVAAVLVGVLVLLALALAVTRVDAATRWRRRIREIGVALMEAAPGLLAPRALIMVAIATAASFLLAALHFVVLAAGAGLSVSPLQAALLVGAVTLSTAIPAGPASIGTFEFVGTTLLTGMGFDPEPSLLVVALFHVVAVAVPAGLGLVAGWALHALPNRRLIGELR